jgi:hypothetical protein
MTRCIACGTENKAEARFCRQCGIRLESALAEADSDVTIAVPAPAAPAAAGRDDEHTLITRWASQRPAETAGEAAPASSEDTIPAAIPAVIATAAPAKSATPVAPRRSRAWLIGALAVAAVVLIGAFAYLVIGSGKRSPEVAAVPKAESPARAPAPAAAVVPPPPAAVALAPPPVEAPPAATEVAVPPIAAESIPAASPQGEAGTAAQPPAQRPARPADGRDRQKADRLRQREAAEAARRAAAQPAPPPPAPAAEPAPAPAPEPKPVSRWERMAQENSACEAESFFARLACKEKVRWKYCPGYWGKVPQCPQGTDPMGGG